MESESGTPSVSARQCPQCGAIYPNNERFCTQDGAVLTQLGAAADIVGSVLGGKYRVERLIGSGGMGDVYQVRHVHLDQVRAIKRMQCETIGNATNVERFRREARQQGRIRHPNVATLYDFEEERDGSCFLVMEFVDGRSLGDLIKEPGRMPVARVAAIVSQMASALDAAHEEGVVHRDLKPDNVLIASGRDGSDRVKVVDFGIATLIDNPGQSSRITSTGFVIGTPRYMSPEQLLPNANESIDGRSDTYALGLLAMEMLLGKLPYDTQDLADILRRAASPPPQISIASTEVRLPATLDPIFSRVLATDRNMRYATATAFANEFVETLANAGLTPGIDRLPRPTPIATDAFREGVVGPPAVTAVRARTRWYAIAGGAALTGLALVGYLQLSGPKGAVDAGDSARLAGVTPGGAVPDTAGHTKDSTPMVVKADSPAISTPTKGPTPQPGKVSGQAVAGPGLSAPARLQLLNDLPDPTVADAPARVRELTKLLPELTTSADTVAADLLMVEALFVLTDTRAICTILPRLRKMSANTAQAPTTAYWSETVTCQPSAPG